MRVAALAAILAASLPGLAFADSIDGAWCLANGRRMVITVEAA